MRFHHRTPTLLFALLLAVPAALLLADWVSGATDTMDMVAPTGAWAARFTIAAMMVGPLVRLFGANTLLAFWLRRRRSLGIAASLYAAVHLGFYVADMGDLDAMLAELLAPGIWTGWAALLVMVPLFLSSNDRAQHALGAAWKRLQRLVYPAALLALVHWGFVHNGWGEALLHFGPLALLLAADRLARVRRRRPPDAFPTYSPPHP